MDSLDTARNEGTSAEEVIAGRLREAHGEVDAEAFTAALFEHLSWQLDMSPRCFDSPLSEQYTVTVFTERSDPAVIAADPDLLYAAHYLLDPLAGPEAGSSRPVIMSRFAYGDPGDWTANLVFGDGHTEMVPVADDRVPTGHDETDPLPVDICLAIMRANNPRY